MAFEIKPPSTIDFILRSGKQRFSQAVAKSYDYHESKLEEYIFEALDGLGDWAGKALLANGYELNPEVIEVLQNEFDYNTQMGIGVLFEGKYQDDIRGFISALMYHRETLERTNEAQLTEIIELQDIIYQIDPEHEKAEKKIDMEDL